ncbi:MAG: penicillin acylase family protein, partial [Thermoleophilaceae bacterium]
MAAVLAGGGVADAKVVQTESVLPPGQSGFVSAEWRGLLPRNKTPHVINPHQGYLMQWNNVPSMGWTAG